MPSKAVPTDHGGRKAGSRAQPFMLFLASTSLTVLIRARLQGTPGQGWAVPSALGRHGAAVLVPSPHRAVVAPRTVRAAASVYDLPPQKDLTGADFSFDKIKGEVAYAVNVASKCGYTAKNYAEFKTLADKEGVALLLFPCGQFGGQEFRTDAEIKAFVEKQGLGGKPNVHVLAKGDVTGPKMQTAWKFMKEATDAPDPGWNFEGKFVIGKTGDIKRVPRGGNVMGMVEEALAE